MKTIKPCLPSGSAIAVCLFAAWFLPEDWQKGVMLLAVAGQCLELLRVLDRAAARWEARERLIGASGKRRASTWM